MYATSLNTHAVIIFELNLFVTGPLSREQWNQILNDILQNDPDTDIRMLILNRNEAYIFPVLSSLAILLATISIPPGIFIYLLAPVYIVLIWVKETRSHRLKQKARQNPT
jgi:hypothetical protein